jgi:hypothetical protein
MSEKQTTSTGYMKKVTPTSGAELPSKEKYYPSIHLSSKDLKEIKNWEVGKTYKVILEIKQKSMSEDADKTISASFDIIKIGIK